MKHLKRNQHRETFEGRFVTQIELLDGTRCRVAPGDHIVWEDRPCGCCADPIRVEPPLAN